MLLDVAEELEGDVGVLSVFGYVEALQLGRGADAQDAQLLQREEYRSAHAERPGRGNARAEHKRRDCLTALRRSG